MNKRSYRDCLVKEIIFSTSRASGPGGQHVNKTESRVVLSWDLEASSCLGKTEKLLVRERLSSRITEKGILIRMPVDKIRQTGRSSQGVRLVALGEGDAVSTVTKVVKTDDATEADSAEESE